MASTLGSRTWLGSILTAAMASTMAIVTTPGLATTVLLRNSITPGYYKGADGSSFSYYYGNGYGGSSLSYTYGYGQYAFPPQVGSPEPAPGRSNLPPSVIPPTVPVSVSVTFADVPGVKVNLSFDDSRRLKTSLEEAGPYVKQAFFSMLGSMDSISAAATLASLAASPSDQTAKVLTTLITMPRGESLVLLSLLASVTRTEVIAFMGVTATLPEAAAVKIFSAICSLVSEGKAVRFAIPSQVSHGLNGTDVVQYTFDAPGLQASGRSGDAEVAGVTVTPAERVVMVIAKPGQQARVARGDNGSWPIVALPVTSGNLAGLITLVSSPADVTDLWFEPAPRTTSDAERGSVGGGFVTPLGAPWSITAIGTRSSQVGLSLPNLPVHSSYRFSYLLQVGNAAEPDHGYKSVPPTLTTGEGRINWTMPVGDIFNTRLLPVALRPAFVQNFDALVRIFSSPDPRAESFGYAGPQFTTFTVVGPQVGARIFVFNPVTENYGWIDASGVGPVDPPK